MDQKSKSYVKTIKKILQFFLVVLILASACSKEDNNKSSGDNCDPDLVANTTFSKIKEFYKGDVIQIQEDLIIEGYVISSDKAGNFFGSLHIQDNPVNPKEGFQIDIDLRDSHLFFEIGSLVLVKLKGLYLGKRRGVFKIGGQFTVFGNLSVGRIPAAAVSHHILRACSSIEDILPKLTTIDDLDDTMINTFIQLGKVEISQQELGQTFAHYREEVERTLIDCHDHNIILLNSGFSIFWEEILPAGNGNISGILSKDKEMYQIIIRDMNDIEFSGDRCNVAVIQHTSGHVFISELADPDNNTGARFIELYNAGSEPINLKDWKLNRYTNDKMEIGSSINLSQFVIAAKSTLVISPNTNEFELVYGFLPDLGVGTNSPADSNGDDNIELVDPFGRAVDVFGVIGEDGSGTNHEFEDGKASRNLEISSGNPVFNQSEWTVYNDTGTSGTINQPQIAPMNFTPGIR